MAEIPTAHSVFVLGAGFTKAFLPSSPLLIDDYGAEFILEKLNGLPHSKQLLQTEMRANKGKINIERMMSRLDGGMPYDGLAEQTELGFLASELRRAFVQKIQHARSTTQVDSLIHRVSSYCVATGTTCLTFNYDEVLDQALFEVRPHPLLEVGECWNPDSGYGFYCRGSASCIGDSLAQMDRTRMLLLKLHGSTNWRLKVGHAAPYGADAIVHHEDWVEDEWLLEHQDLVERHLLDEALIVPPVLVKSGFTSQPVLQIVWRLARQFLQRASEVTFVGYSMPLTDIAATYLFGEAISEQTQIRVINPQTGTAQDDLKQRYRHALGRDDIEWFVLDARKWAESLPELTIELS